MVLRQTTTPVAMKQIVGVADLCMRFVHDQINHSEPLTHHSIYRIGRGGVNFICYGGSNLIWRESI